jgi:hypothetical protein
MRTGWLMVAVVACGTPPSVVADAGARMDVTADRSLTFSDGSSGADASPSWPPCTATAQPPLLATCQINPDAIAVDDENVYWTNFGHDTYVGGGMDPVLTPSGDGALMKCAKTGCGGTPTVLVGDIVPNEEIFIGGATGELTLTGGGVYFELDANGAEWIESCTTGGCGESPSLAFGATEALLFGLTSDATNLYWVEEKDGSETTYACVAASCNGATSIWAASPALGVVDIAVDESNIYWAIEDEDSTNAGIRGLVMACPKVGCSAPTILAVTAPYDAQTLALDDTNVYFGGQGGIASCAKTGCSIPTAIAGDTVTQITSDGTTLYWLSMSNTAISIDSCPTAGCNGSPTVVTTPGGPFAIDATNIYWLNDLGENAPPCGSVHSKPR